MSQEFNWPPEAVIAPPTPGGTVIGPASSTDNAVVRFDGGSGTVLQNSNVTIDDLGNIATTGTVDGRDLSDDGAAADAHYASTAAHGATGAVVGTTNTQTLTNKTLTSPVINNPTGITKANVGLGNVDNTSDATKDAALTTLTNKTISGAANTISNISFAAINSFSSSAFLGKLVNPSGTGLVVFNDSPTLITPALGTPSSAVLTNATGLPISTGVSGLATGAATFLATPTSANLAALLTDETGSGANVFATSPTLVTPALGTPSSAILTNATGLPLNSGVTGTLPIGNGGTGQATAAAAFNALSPMTAVGDIIVGGTAGAGNRLAVGATGRSLRVSAGTPAWQEGAAGSSTGSAIAAGDIGQVVNSGTLGAGTVNATTYTTISGGSVTLTAGVWKITYEVSAQVNPSATANAETLVAFGISTGTTNNTGIISGTERSSGFRNTTGSGTAPFTNFVLTASAFVSISGSTTYALQGKYVTASGTGTAQIMNTAPSQSILYAVRIG